MNITATLFAQAAVFALFIAFTVKFIWPYMLRAIEARQKTIADGLAAAEEGKRSLEVSARQAEEQVRKARERATEVIAQAERRAVQLIEEAKLTARTEGERELTAAKAEIEQELARAREQLRDQVAMLAVAGAEKILRREVDSRAHGQMLDEIKRQI
jgi:F-type H+-transporting ATPase subunit b